MTMAQKLGQQMTEMTESHGKYKYTYDPFAYQKGLIKKFWLDQATEYKKDLVLGPKHKKRTKPVDEGGTTMLYEVAVVKRATEGKGAAAKEALLLAPTAVVASNEKAAIYTAMSKLSSKSVDPNHIDVLVRPFV